MKHNKYKNIGVIYEALCTAVLKEVGEGNNNKAKMYMSLIKKYFMNDNALQEVWAVYNQLLYNETVNYFYADRFLTYLIQEYNSVDKKSLNNIIKNLFEDVSKFSSKKDLMKARTPNYKLFASFNILAENTFSQSSERIQCERVIAEHLIDNQEADKLRTQKQVFTLSEENGVDVETRKLADILALKSFEEKYKYVLNEDQKEMLIKYITSTSDSSFNRWAGKRVKNILEGLENFEHYSLNAETREKLYLVSEKLKNLTTKKSIVSENDLQTVLLCLKIKDSLKLFE